MGREEISKEVDVLFTKGKLNRKRFGRGGKSQTKANVKPRYDGIEEDECTFYQEKGHRKNECPKLKSREKPKKDEVNVAQKKDDDFGYS